eukprot:TRINITY_DN201_c0_g1_i1.p1 TRINITY_DN201_c0_g1~~TRINITY_DN201_c0_g1_i1.p1  ORF type:complete len:328 (-),score=77.86 TRINITY_DN201_c0_g1_i1:176-1159(-)
MPSVRIIRDWYLVSFHELRKFPCPIDVQSEVEFTRLLQLIYQRHSPTQVKMAKAIHELMGELKKILKVEDDLLNDFGSYGDLHQALDTFFMSRIGMRMIIGQHLELHQQHSRPKPNFVGLICTATSPAQVAQDAIDDAKYMCDRQTGEAPEVTLHGRTDLFFNYVPSHLYYILFELLKNSMRATVEFHSKKLSFGGVSIGAGAGATAKQSKVLPPIRVIIADEKDNEDVVIKISDDGGGIPRSSMTRTFSYLFTTAKDVQKIFASLEEIQDFDREAPLAGLGVGLPLSRLYAQYFGGDLSLTSMESHGTDAYVHLSRRGDKLEPIIL